ncbi:MAG: GTP-binding protein Era, partial [Planctomycetaceae bacterium]
GEKLKRIGTDARQDIETLLERKVMLNIWVKVKANWSDDDRALKSLGYDDV